MAVIIHNVSPRGTPDDQEHDYDVRINYNHIASFKHVRNEGLEKCLLRAAKAVREAGEGEFNKPT